MHSLIVEGLGKRYSLAKAKAKESTPPQRRLNLGFASLPLPAFLSGSGEKPELWALRGVSFTVDQGTILGLIGPNGAGKSTLLKVIARVTRPTEGRVRGRGRVVSLLELGAGFNPDFSARENILMNGAMHGVPRAEVLKSLDDIVAFSEIDRFLDTPLKHYSSGMYLRLAFSVAINMKPDLLLADEILAVGDIAFQERCLQRVEDEAKKGLTVLFVSHDMAAIARLCGNAVWLDKGAVRKVGPANELVAEYQDAALESTKFGRGDPTRGRHANLYCEISNVRLMNAAHEIVGAANLAEDSYIRIRLRVLKGGVELQSMVDAYVKGVFAFRSVQQDPIVAEGRGVVDLLVHIPPHFLSETTYTFHVTVDARQDKEARAYLPNALSFLAYGSEDAALYRHALLAPRFEWSVRKHLYVAQDTEFRRRKTAELERRDAAARQG